MTQAILEIKHLKKSYGQNEVLKDISLTVHKGEVISIIGSSGSGKSTFLRSINLLETPTDGQILYHGQNVLEKGYDLTQYREKLGMVFQSFNLFNNMSVLKNCMIGQMTVLKRSREESQKKAEAFLEKVGMSQFAGASPAQLSGGQRQRVAIARALCMDPEILLFDEPTSALDVSVRAQILNLLSDLKKSLGLSLVFISHDIQTVRYVSDEIVVMNHGTIVERGAAYDVLNNPQDSYTKLLLGAAPSLLHPTAEECR